MPKRLHQRVLRTIDTHSMMRPGTRVGVGVSGGADSVALLRLLMELRSRLGIELEILHFHHQLRGAEADQDQRFVQDLAQAWHLPFTVDRRDVAATAQREGWNLEDAARRMRYGFFADAAQSRRLTRVAVAHTLEDQAETVLAHLIRGTGPTGLAGIHPVAGIIVRPLLEVSREDLRGYLTELQQTWCEDSTNLDTSRMRARIRHQLMPLLHRDFAPAAVSRLARLADFARDEEKFWQALEQERFEALVVAEPSGSLVVNIAQLLNPLPALGLNALDSNQGYPGAQQPASLALSRRLVRRIVLQLRQNRRQLTARHVTDVLRLAVRGQSGSTIALPGLVVERVFDCLRFSAADGTLSGRGAASPNFEYCIDSLVNAGHARIAVPEISRSFSLKIVDCPSSPRQTNSGECLLDLGRIRWPLILRSWRQGDGYRPVGSQRVQKVRRLLMESRVPSSLRINWPVLDSAGDLIWSPGCPVAHGFAAGPGAQAGLQIAEVEF
jgi:tRNA(Ile)-lysidine synthase